jgi:AAA15 family ATPase/GTPase
MLIEFKVTNFRSFRDTQTLSMVAGNFAEHTEANTFDAELSGFGRFLRSSVVYGPNAAGKTNLLRALQFMQALVVSSATATPATGPPYTPFKFARATRDAPSEFQVTFVQNLVRYEYGFSIDATRICEEWLVEYAHPRGREIFTRTYNEKIKDYNWKFSSFFRGQRSVWSEATRPNALFLSIATQLNSKQLLPVFEWFQKRLVVIVGVTTLNPVLTLQLLRQLNGKQQLLPFLQEADLGIADLEITREPIPSNAILVQPSPIIEQAPGDLTPNLVKVTFTHMSDTNEPVDLDLAEESSGAQVLFRSAGAWLNVFANGEVLLFDEIDTSLHPLLIRYLVTRFHSGATNPNNAQLIFTTHNTSLLDQEIFRRDQIWFVDKIQDGSSRLYPLTDFKPRNDEVLERWYMRGRYGALPLLDEIPN